MNCKPPSWEKYKEMTYSWWNGAVYPASALQFFPSSLGLTKLTKMWYERRNIFFTFVEPSNSKPSRKAPRSELMLDQNWCVEADCLINICKLQTEYARFCTIRLFAVVSLSSVLNCFNKETAIMNSLLGWTSNHDGASNFCSRFLFSAVAKYDATRELEILRNIEWGWINNLHTIIHKSCKL